MGYFRCYFALIILFWVQAIGLVGSQAQAQSLSQTQALQSQRLLHLATTEYPPFYSKNLPEFGLVPDICVQSFERMGYQVKVSSYPFARAVKLLQSGEIDGFLGLWYRESRLGWAHYSKPLLSHKIRLYKRVEDNISFDNFESLRQYLIGIGLAYANPKSFVDAKLKTEAATSDEINLKKLFHGRIDLVLISENVAQYLISTGPGPYRGMFEPIGKPVGEEWFHFAAAKGVSDHQKLVADFNQGLSLLIADGTLAAIFERHGFTQNQIPSQE